jgi:hypothetical protein
MISSKISALLSGTLLDILVLLILFLLFSTLGMLTVSPLVVVVMSSGVAIVIVFFLTVLI